MTAVKRFTSVILASFAGIGLPLAVMGYTESSRILWRNELRRLGFDWRSAPHGAPWLWLVSSQGLRMALAGVAIGLTGTVLAAQSMTSLLYGISALDPVAIGLASIVLIAIALGACLLPARLAAKIDPTQARRTE